VPQYSLKRIALNQACQHCGRATYVSDSSYGVHFRLVCNECHAQSNRIRIIGKMKKTKKVIKKKKKKPVKKVKTVKIVAAVSRLDSVE